MLRDFILGCIVGWFFGYVLAYLIYKSLIKRFEQEQKKK